VLATANGSNNVTIGHAAGGGTGTNNTLVGAYSGDSSTTGSYNTFIGASAGYLATSGNYNTIIGPINGMSPNTLSGVVAIGADSSGNNATASANNDFVLGTSNHNVKIPGTLTVNGNLIPYAQAAGTHTGPASLGPSTGSTMTVVGIFPAGRFSVTPKATITAWSTGFAYAIINPTSTLNADIRYYNPTGSTPTGITGTWIAIQMTPTSASG
jgi:hypothetical protein